MCGGVGAESQGVADREQIINRPAEIAPPASSLGKVTGQTAGRR